MSYQAFYVPRTKGELIKWLARYLHHVKLNSLKKMPVKQLYAIFYRIRSDM